MSGEKHLPFFKLLEALESSGCPVCRQADEAAEDTIRHVLHELVNDDRLRNRLAESFGFCHEHAWRVVSHRDVLGTAILHRDLVGRLRSLLAGAPGRRAGGSACLVCESAEGTSGQALAVLLDQVDDPRLREAFEASDGLCRAHYERAMGVAGTSEHATGALTAMQGRCLDRLLGELDEVIRKHDYRFRHEEWQPGERTAWLRAVAAVSGLDARQLPRARPARFPPGARPGGLSE